MIVVKIDILEALKIAGYSTYKLQKDRIFGGRTVNKFKHGHLPSWGELDKICNLTGLNVCDIVEWVEDSVVDSSESEDR